MVAVGCGGVGDKFRGRGAQLLDDEAGGEESTHGGSSQRQIEGGGSGVGSGAGGTKQGDHTFAGDRLEGEKRINFGRGETGV